MKKTERWLAVIRTDDRDEPQDRDETANPFASMMIDMGSLAWQATKTVLPGGEEMLPRDFELTIVPGPEDLQ